VATGLDEAKTYDGYVADLKQRISELERLASGASPSDRAALTQSQALYVQQMHDFEARALVARHSTEYVDAAIVRVGDPTAVRSSNSRIKFGLVLQGLIAGLSIGVIIAFGREWVRTRRRVA
jgi:UDP-N-acetylglucosamine enolpyruvyl transferase